jgi:large subunit ribosomal protein L15
MRLTELLKAAGAYRRRKRRGRGEGSGLGKTSGRGNKGANSRSGTSGRILAEGGQMPLFRRLPKRGFSNAGFRMRFSIVNVCDLEESFEGGAHVTPLAMVEAGLVRHLRQPIKVLGDGELKKKLVVEAHRFSQAAAEKIRKGGGEPRVVLE